MRPWYAWIWLLVLTFEHAVYFLKGAYTGAAICLLGVAIVIAAEIRSSGVRHRGYQ